MTIDPKEFKDSYQEYARKMKTASADRASRTRAAVAETPPGDERNLPAHRLAVFAVIRSAAIDAVHRSIVTRP